MDSTVHLQLMRKPGHCPDMRAECLYLPADSARSLRGSHGAGYSSMHAQQGVHFDISIGLLLPGSSDSWEPFNPTFLGLGTPAFAQSLEAAQSSDLWGSQETQQLPSYHLMSSVVSDMMHASSADDASSDAQCDASTHAAAHCTVTSRGRAAGKEDALHALDSCKPHGSSITCVEPAPETTELGRCNLTCAMRYSCIWMQALLHTKARTTVKASLRRQSVKPKHVSAQHG